jgi:hypothetical protein
VSGLDGRLRRIEARARPAKPCPECGVRPGEPPSFSYGGTQHPDEPPVEYCRSCGRILRFSLDLGGTLLDK